MNKYKFAYVFEICACFAQRQSGNTAASYPALTAGQCTVSGQMHVFVYMCEFAYTVLYACMHVFVAT